MKTEQATIVYAQWDRWTSYDVIKHHKMLYQNSSKGKQEFVLLRTSLSHAISRLYIIFSLKSSLFLFKIEKSSKDGEKDGEM